LRILQVRQQSAQIEERTARLHRHEEIHVAFWCVFAMNNGTEHTDIQGAVLSRDAQDVRAVPAEELFHAHGALNLRQSS